MNRIAKNALSSARKNDDWKTFLVDVTVLVEGVATECALVLLGCSEIGDAYVVTADGRRAVQLLDGEFELPSNACPEPLRFSKVKSHDREVRKIQTVDELDADLSWARRERALDAGRGFHRNSRTMRNWDRLVDAHLSRRRFLVRRDAASQLELSLDAA